MKEDYGLYAAFSHLKNEDEVSSFLKDLCTPNELKIFKERWLLAQLLNKKKYSYKNLEKKVGASTTTVGRVARFLNVEKNGGYKLVLERINSEK